MSEVKKMKDTFCAKCGQALYEGSVKYTVHIKIVSDFDGFIPCSEKDSSKEIQRLLKEMETIDVQELEDDVYQEFALYLCLQCKKNFTKELINSEEEHFSPSKNLGNVFH